MKIFKAKSVKNLNKVIFEDRYCPWLLTKIDRPPDDKPLEIKDDEEALKPNKDEFQYPMPKSGPPKSWLDEFGRTPGCTACSNEKLHGRHHNKGCKARYLAWQKSQREESTEIAPIDLEKHSSSSNPIPSSLPIEYQPPSRVRAAEDIPSLAAPPLYTPSEAPSAGDVSLGDVEDDSMEVDLHEFIDPAIHSQVFATMFSDSPEVHHNRNGTLPLLNGRQVLHPFYLPKIGEATKYDEFQLGGKKVFLARPIQVRSENTYEPLSVDKTVEARLVELEALERVKFGRVIDKATAEKFCKDNDTSTWMSGWKLGSMGRINGLFHLLINRVFLGVITH